MNRKTRTHAWILASGILAAGAAQAAGGHHAVDDAAILDTDSCELESWLIGARGGQRLLHAGASCRVGPVELGMAAEHAREPGARQTAYALQVKWAGQWVPGLHLGVSVTPAWQAHERPRYQGTTVSGLATWAVNEDVAVHANLGRDFIRAATDEGRSGVAVEWSPQSGWFTLAERYVEQHAHFLRGGLRWAAGEEWTVDLSRAHRLHGPGVSNWTFGVTRRFSR